MKLQPLLAATEPCILLSHMPQRENETAKPGNLILAPRAWLPISGPEQQHSAQGLTFCCK